MTWGDLAMRVLAVILLIIIGSFFVYSITFIFKDADGKDVELLFQYRGVEVYRFQDRGRIHYFTVPVEDDKCQ